LTDKTDKADKADKDKGSPEKEIAMSKLPSSSPTCASCEKQPSIVWCATCEERFCKNCDSTVHVGRLAEKHSRISNIGEPQFCGEGMHDNNLLSSYCTNCSKLVCTACISASGVHNNHECVSLQEAVHSGLKTLETFHNNLQNKSKALAQDIRKMIEMKSQQDKQLVETQKLITMARAGDVNPASFLNLLALRAPEHQAANVGDVKLEFGSADFALISPMKTVQFIGERTVFKPLTTDETAVPIISDRYLSLGSTTRIRIDKLGDGLGYMGFGIIHNNLPNVSSYKDLTSYVCFGSRTNTATYMYEAGENTKTIKFLLAEGEIIELFLERTELTVKQLRTDRFFHLTVVPRDYSLFVVLETPGTQISVL